MQKRDFLLIINTIAMLFKKHNLRFAAYDDKLNSRVGRVFSANNEDLSIVEKDETLQEDIV